MGRAPGVAVRPRWPPAFLLPADVRGDESPADGTPDVQAPRAAQASASPYRQRDRDDASVPVLAAPAEPDTAMGSRSVLRRCARENQATTRAPSVRSPLGARRTERRAPPRAIVHAPMEGRPVRTGASTALPHPDDAGRRKSSASCRRKRRGAASGGRTHADDPLRRAAHALRRRPERCNDQARDSKRNRLRQIASPVSDRTTPAVSAPRRRTSSIARNRTWAENAPHCSVIISRRP